MINEQHISALEDLKNELISFQSNDVLVHVHAKPHLWETISSPENTGEYTVPAEGKWEKLYKRFQEIYKESGIQTACFVSKTIIWNYKNERIESPLMLIPLEVKLNKNIQQITFEPDPDQAFLNPFIQKQFQQLFELELSLENLADLKEEILQNPLVEAINETSFIGQFHYYRFLFLKEIEEIEAIEKSAILEKLFGNPEIQEKPFSLTEKTILPGDPTQQKVLHEAGKASLVLQGPPGTGKSQVLINILGKMLVTDSITAVVSEKRAALEVIQKKLSGVGLADYTVFLDDQVERKSVYAQLKKTWQQLESFSENTSSSVSITALKKQQLQLLLDRLQNEQLSSGISFWELKALREKLPDHLNATTAYSCSVAEWKSLKPVIVSLEKLPFELWNFFPQEFWQAKQLQHFLEWAAAFEKYSLIFAISDTQDLLALNQWCVISQLQSSSGYKNYLEIIRSKTKWKQFQKLKRNYFSAKAAKEAVKQKTHYWKFIPTEEQLERWEQLPKKLFGKRKLKKYLDSISPEISLGEVTGICSEYFSAHEKFSACQQELITLGIFHAEQDFTEIDLLQQRYERIHENQWKTFEQLNEEQLNYLKKEVVKLLEFSRKSPFCEAKERIEIQKAIQLVQLHLTGLNKVLPALQQLPKAVYYWANRLDSWQVVEQQLICNEWKNFELLFPEMAQLSMSQVRALLNEIIRSEADDQHQFITAIHAYRKAKFDANHQLLLQSSSKLSAEQKQLRQELKKGKALLIKEMNKSRQFLPLRALWNSEARHWLSCLAPVWIMTPTQVAKHFPMEKNLFQLTLIDEASQIPTSHLIGTLQRSQQVIIAGDSQQMAPSAFFLSEEKTDVLQFAQFYLKNYPLKYHYRSQHPDLIRFSNRYFYNDELEIFPSKTQQGQPLEWIFAEDGRYADSKNPEEAIIVVKQIEKYIGSTETLGIVAFSETQLQTIWNKLKPSVKEKLQQRIDNETAFFKPLEKVQGDECDVLIISFGYGKDEKGNFKLHLGPLLKQQGEKRLNVLFSRAKQKIIFISSVKPEDFPLSDNNSVHLLKNFFRILADSSQNTTSSPPDLVNWLKTISSAEELVTKYRIYRERGWDI